MSVLRIIDDTLMINRWIWSEILQKMLDQEKISNKYHNFSYKQSPPIISFLTCLIIFNELCNLFSKKKKKYTGCIWLYRQRKRNKISKKVSWRWKIIVPWIWIFMLLTNEGLLSILSISVSFIADDNFFLYLILLVVVNGKIY